MMGRFIISEQEKENILSKYNLNEMEDDFDPCMDRQIKFWQSNEGKELLQIMRDYFMNPIKTKMPKEIKKRFKELLNLQPKC